jgi:uncharacterized protein
MSDDASGESALHQARGRGFASMNKERHRELAKQGGRAAQERGTAHKFAGDEAREAGRKGGEAVSRDREYMAKIGREGARRSALVRGKAKVEKVAASDALSRATPQS